MAIQGPERLIQIPGMRALSSKEALDRIDRFIRQVPGLTAVIVIGREGDTQNISCKHTSNMTRDQVRETLRRSAQLLEGKGAILPPR